jgi:predicted ABC-type ATPase
VTFSLDKRPIIVALAGPNGAGKSTFFAAYLQLGAYEAADLAKHVRQGLSASRESFVFETVFSDPVGEKVEFLSSAVRAGYTVTLCFIGLDKARTSEERVAMRVLQGGHDVPTEKLLARFARSLRNLERAIRELPSVHVFDNSDLRQPFRKVAEFRDGKRVAVFAPIPAWLKPKRQPRKGR